MNVAVLAPIEAESYEAKKTNFSCNNRATKGSSCCCLEK
jgi:hypothetical protein